MAEFDVKNLTIGCTIWTADYEYGRVRCTKNIEPEEVVITNTSEYGARGTNSKGGSLIIRDSNCFNCEEDAKEYYQSLLISHVNNLLSSMTYLLTQSTLNKKLNKFGLSELSIDLVDISHKAKEVQNKLIND